MSAKEREKLEKTGLDIYYLLLGDFARTDVQARIVNEIITRKNGYQLRYGRTYLEAWSKLVPSAFWKVKQGTLIKRVGNPRHLLSLTPDRGSYDPVHWFSTRIYGLGGEAMNGSGLPGLGDCLDDFWSFYRMAEKETCYFNRDTDARWAMIPLIILSHK